MEENPQTQRILENTRDRYLQNLVSIRGRRNAITHDKIPGTQTLEYLSKLPRNPVATSRVLDVLEEWSLINIQLMRFTVIRGRRNAVSAPNVVHKIRPKTYHVCSY